MFLALLALFAPPSARSAQSRSKKKKINTNDIWGYVGTGGRAPDKWGGECQAGSWQSPVDLADPEYNGDIPGFQFVNYAKEPWAVKISNNGHSLKVSMQVGVERQRKVALNFNIVASINRII